MIDDVATSNDQDQEALLFAALAYGERGYRVFPVHSVDSKGRCSCGRGNCGSVGKHPRIRDWVNQATTDETIIRQWWKRWPQANIGIATGRGSGVVVIDVDPRHGGDESLATLIGAHGSHPLTVEATTGGGGRHILFAHPGSRVPNKASLAPGIDIRGDGGFVVAPPSTHASRRRYEWKPGQSPQELSPTPLPAWPLDSPKWITIGSDIETDGPIAEGKRNQTLTSLGGTMRRRGMSYEAILAALQQENTQRCNPPLAEEEVERIALSVARYRPAEATPITKGPMEGTLPSGQETDLPASENNTPTDVLDGANLLRELEDFVSRYVAPPCPESLSAISLWVLSTYAFDLFEQHPFLVITSPEKRCGKTRLLEVLERVVHNPLQTAGMSEAVLFRVASKRSPTFLIDEAQHLRNRDERSAPIHDLLCAGNRRGKKVLRMGGQNHTQLHEFEIYCPKAIATIGKLTDIIMDRSIDIAMRRRTQAEQVGRFFLAKAEVEAQPIRQRIVGWISGHKDEIRAVYVSEEPPTWLTDRQAENWAPLFSILRVADPSRVSYLEEAARLILRSETDGTNSSLRVLLLTDIKGTFENQKTDFITSNDLLKALLSKEESPWGDDSGGRVLTTQGLAKLLRPFDVRPRQTNRGGNIVRGYHRDDLLDAWTRYLPAEPVTPVTTQSGSNVQAGSDPLLGEVRNRLGSGVDPRGERVVTEITGSNPPPNESEPNQAAGLKAETNPALVPAAPPLPPLVGGQDLLVSDARSMGATGPPDMARRRGWSRRHRHRPAPEPMNAIAEQRGGR